MGLERRSGRRAKLCDSSRQRPTQRRHDPAAGGSDRPRSENCLRCSTAGRELIVFRRRFRGCTAETTSENDSGQQWNIVSNSHRGRSLPPTAGSCLHWGGSSRPRSGCYDVSTAGRELIVFRRRFRCAPAETTSGADQFPASSVVAILLPPAAGSCLHWGGSDRPRSENCLRCSTAGRGIDRFQTSFPRVHSGNLGSHYWQNCAIMSGRQCGILGFMEVPGERSAVQG